MDFDDYEESRFINRDEWLAFEEHLLSRGYRLARYGETSWQSPTKGPEEAFVNLHRVSAVSQS